MSDVREIPEKNSARGGSVGSGGGYPKISCGLCPHGCNIGHGEAGDCRVRVNFRGKLYAVTFGRPCAVNLDPIEKKPLYHMLPGSRTLSIATAGCNLHCKNCQNASISQANPEDVRIRSWPKGDYGISPENLVKICETRGISALSYTYTEPVIYYEYTYETAKLARSRGIKNITVTAGYINAKPLRKLCKYLDASNVDLKTMNPEFFRSNCGGELKHVLDGLVVAKEEGVWLEVTNLILPGLNDSKKETQSLCGWIVKNLGAETPLHFSRFYPHHQLRNLSPTPVTTMKRARDIALEAGLKFVYIGNLRGRNYASTVCPSCGQMVIKRVGYTITSTNISDGRCGNCDTKIPGIWR